MKTLLTVGAPSGVQIVADVLAWSLFGMWVMAQFGTDAMAGNNFMFQYMKMSFMPAFGIAVAVTGVCWWGDISGWGSRRLPNSSARTSDFLFARST